MAVSVAATPTELTADAQHAKKAFEVPVLLAALAVIPVVFIEESTTSVEWQTAAFVANWLIWAAFALEFAIVSGRTESRRSYAKKDLLDVTILVVSFPLLPHLLAVSRLARLIRLAEVLRILRLVRVAAVVTRGSQSLRSLFGHHGLGYLMAMAALLALAFGSVFTIVEPSVESAADGLWWAIVTVTTVGYGDIAPTTGLGRLAASGLMIVGIGFVAIVTAAIAARFVEIDDQDDDERLMQVADKIQSMEAQLERIERSLAERRPT